MEMNFANTTIFLVLFTAAFILMDEYIAKPWRRRRMEHRAKTDPEVRAALELAAEVEKLRAEGKITH